MVPAPRTALRFLAFAGVLFCLGAPSASDTPEHDSGEVYRSPARGAAWRAVRDEASGAKWFEGPGGERADSVAEIAAREAETLPEIERIVGRDLAVLLADPAAAGELVDVTVIFRRQPAHDAGMDARARYAPLMAQPLARSREIAAAAAARRGAVPPGEKGLGRAIEDEARFLTDAEKAELLAARDEVRSLSARMRRDVIDWAKPAAAADQARVAAWLADRAGVTPLGRSWTLSTVSARVPVAAVGELVLLFPEIARIQRCRGAQPTLDTSTSTVGASSWWNAGYTGTSSTKVAVLDTGCDSGHPALSVSNAAVFLTSGSSHSWFADNANSTDDIHSHGTHVSGIVASSDSTYTGVAPQTGLMNAKCGYQTTNGGGSLDDPDIFSAGDWAGDNGAVVMNCSFGGGGTTNGSDGMSLFFDAAAFDLSIAVAIAAGNSGSSSGTVTIPGDAFNVLTLGSFDDNATGTNLGDDFLASYSSRGPTFDGRRKPDISAPGSNIMSCSNTWEGNPADFVAFNGTSMASPHGAGAMALLLDYGTSWSPEALKALLVTTSRNTTPAPSTPDNNWGWGGMDLAAAYTNRASVAEATLTSSGKPFALLSGGALASGGRVTLAWNRHVSSNNSSAPTTSWSLLDLDLTVYDAATGASLGSSTSSVNSVEQVAASSSSNGIVVKVKRNGSFPSGFSTEYFAVAAESTGTTTSMGLPALSCTAVTAPPTLLGPGQSFSVAVSVQNTGSTVAKSPAVVLTLPAGYTAQGSASQTLADIAAASSATATFTVTSATSGTGSKSISAQAGLTLYGENITSSELSWTHTLDATAPIGTVTIDAGAAYAASSAVSLTITAGDTGGAGLDAMRLRNAGGTWTEWETVASPRAWTLPGEGVDTVQLEIRDVVGNSTTVSDTITLDTVAPVGDVVFGDGTGYTTATTSTFTCVGTDAVSGITDQRISSDGTSFGSWEPYGTGHSVTLPAGDSLTRRWAQLRDAAGNVSAAITGSVIRDFTPPTASVVINGGATVTNQQSVVVEMNAVDAVSPVTGLRLSFDGTTWLPWTSYAPSIGLTLQFADSVNTVYLQFRDGAGNVSATYSDSIFMDASGPVASIAIDGGAAFTGSRRVTISSSATDVSSGVTAMRLRDEGAEWGDWQSYSAATQWDLPGSDGAKRVEAQFRDGSGNVSALVYATIRFDTTPPSAYIAVAGGVPAVNHVDVGVALAASDGGSGVAEFRIRNEGGAWTPWASARASEQFALDGEDGVKRVYAQFRDAVGNLSAEVYDDVLLDVTPPAGTLALNGGRGFVLPWEEIVAEPLADDGPEGSGVSTVEFSSDAGATWTATVAIAPQIAIPGPGVADAPVEVLARWRDVAGNVSESASSSAYVVADAVQGLGAARSLRGALAAGGDVDAYSVELVAGDTLSVRVAAKPGSASHDFSAEVDLYDPSRAQAVLGRWPASARRPGIAKYVAPATGTYVLVVRAAGDDAAAGGGYTLTTKIARTRAALRVRGTAPITYVGETPTASVVFAAADGESLSGTVRIPVPTSFQVVSPDGRIDGFILRPYHGKARFSRPLTGGTGDFELRCATIVPVRYALRVRAGKRAARATEIPPAGGR
jgi:serine protease AprX